jgi:hypothetical protein
MESEKAPNKPNQIEKTSEMLEAGTGFMDTLFHQIHKLQDEGYTENLVAKYDHFECHTGEVQMYPKEIKVDKIVRFENTSDPDDTSILYAISVPGKSIKGLYVESYGPSQDGVNREMLEALKDHPH